MRTSATAGFLRVLVKDGLPIAILLLSGLGLIVCVLSRSAVAQDAYIHNYIIETSPVIRLRLAPKSVRSPASVREHLFGINLLVQYSLRQNYVDTNCETPCSNQTFLHIEKQIGRYDTLPERSVQILRGDMVSNGEPEKFEGPDIFGFSVAFEGVRYRYADGREHRIKLFVARSAGKIDFVVECSLSTPVQLCQASTYVPSNSGIAYQFDFPFNDIKDWQTLKTGFQRYVSDMVVGLVTDRARPAGR